MKEASIAAQTDKLTTIHLKHVKSTLPVRNDLFVHPFFPGLLTLISVYDRVEGLSSNAIILRDNRLTLYPRLEIFPINLIKSRSLLS